MAKPILCQGCNEKFEPNKNGAAFCPLCNQLVTDPIQTTNMHLLETQVVGAPIEVSDDELLEQFAGRRFGQYDVISFLGKGGMALVFKAEHRGLHRPCAIKILSPKLLRQGERFLEMFVAEARAAASVVHPNIVTVHNIGEIDNTTFIELEYVQGQPLQSLILEKGKLSPESTFGHIRQATAALNEAHLAGIVHRDFKPSNILVKDGGLTKLSDFGLAKKISMGDKGPDQRKLSGTPYFMAPELFIGKPATPRSDVYAVGISMFYMLTGKFPFSKNKIALLAEQHKNDPIPDVRSLAPETSDEISDLLFACLAKDRRDRPNSDELLDRTASILGSMRNFDSLIEKSFEGRSAKPKRISATEFVVTIPTREGRSQRIHITDQPPGRWPQSMIRIFSPCAPVSQSYFARALELNSEIPFGSLAIEKIDGAEYFVMVRCYPRATCDPEEIQSSVDSIAKWADEVEQILTGTDQY